MRSACVAAGSCLLGLAALSVSAPAQNVLPVGGRAGVYLGIQHAIDSASPGDVIVVYPSIEYPGFTLNKGVTVRSLDGSFQVSGRVTVEGIPADQSATISGMILVNHDFEGGLSVTHCPGRVTLDRIEGRHVIGTPHRLAIEDCAHVEVTRLLLDEEDSAYSHGDPGIIVERSRVRMHDCLVRGQEGFSTADYGGEGGPGLMVRDSQLEVSASSISGGRGGDINSTAFGSGGPGPGGPGIDATASRILIIGTGDHAVSGGAGGWDRNGSAVGRPGFGMRLQASDVQVSRATFDEVLGDSVTLLAPLPWLTLNPDSRLDDSLQVTLDAGQPLPLLLALFAGLGAAPAGGSQPSLGLAPQSTLVLLTAATTDPSGQWSTSYRIPRDLRLLGVTLSAQALTFAVDGNALTNVNSTVIGITDCNQNLIPDQEDLDSGRSRDCNGNRIPDECEPDCDRDGVPDECEIASGAEQDCNGNGIPDSCDLVSGQAGDCNGNGIPDGCDIFQGTSLDANADGRPDECRRVLRVPSEFGDLQAAVDAAFSGDEIVVADGVYSGARNSNLTPTRRGDSSVGKSLHLRSESGSARCILDLRGRALILRNALGASSLEGLTLRGGGAGSNGGGAILLETSELHLRDVVVEGCRSSFGGGALAMRNGARLRAVDCRFLGNTADYGGAIASTSSYPEDAWIELYQCLLVGNSDGALWLSRTAGVIQGCTFYNNFEGRDRSDQAVLVANASTCFQNCLFWSDLPPGRMVWGSGVGRSTFSFCNVRGGITSRVRRGPGNISVNPLLVDPAGGDFHLSLQSPCIDAGNPSYVPLPGETDLDGDPRVQGWRIDIGHDEVR